MQKAQSGNAQWTALRTACNGYQGGVVNPPSGDAYPNLPDIGQGYQGSDYFEPMMNLGLCYQIGTAIGDANAGQWGAKGADILEAMASFNSYSTDDGYGIRFYGVTMALGFDWDYGALSATQKTDVVNALNAWFAFWDTGGFGRGQSQSNYFAGYYAAKAYSGIATEGDNANASALWDDFLNRLQLGGATALTGPEGTHAGVQMFYSQYLAGGGWSEGWGYGPLATFNITFPSLAALTGKGIDLVHSPSAPFTYPLEAGDFLMHFTWPSLSTIDDRDTLHSGNGYGSPATPSPQTFTLLAGLAQRFGSSSAPQLHAAARAVRTLYGAPSPWADFLFWDDAAPEQPTSTLAKSYLASGMGAVAMRSDWTSSAVWASFRAGPYLDNPYAGEQGFDSGGLAIVRGDAPLLVNPTGTLVTGYPFSPDTYETDVYDDEWGTANRLLSNTFYNGASGQSGTQCDDTPAPQTHVEYLEDEGNWVATRATHLADMYGSGSQISAWSRDVVHLRPERFVVYDRTTVGDTSGDQHLSWHLFLTPTTAASASGTSRYDVNNTANGFTGSVTTVLPAGAATSLVNVVNSSKVYRLEVRPSTPATTTRWLTVFDASTSASAVAAATTLSSSSNVNGVLLASTGGNSAVLFGTQEPGAAISGTITFTEPSAATVLVVNDLTPGSGYSVSAVSAGGNHSVTIQAGGSFTASAHGIVSVTIDASGTVH